MRRKKKLNERIQNEREHQQQHQLEDSFSAFCSAKRQQEPKNRRTNERTANGQNYCYYLQIKGSLSMSWTSMWQQQHEHGTNELLHLLRYAITTKEIFFCARNAHVLLHRARTCTYTRRPDWRALICLVLYFSAAPTVWVCVFCVWESVCENGRQQVRLIATIARTQSHTHRISTYRFFVRFVSFVLSRLFRVVVYSVACYFVFTREFSWRRRVYILLFI